MGLFKNRKITKIEPAERLTKAWIESPYSNSLDQCFNCDNAVRISNISKAVDCSFNDKLISFHELEQIDHCAAQGEIEKSLHSKITRILRFRMLIDGRSGTGMAYKDIWYDNNGISTEDQDCEIID